MIYFLKDPKTRLCKIGRTIRLEVRRRQLNHEFDTTFELLGVISEEKFSEVGLHRLFRHLRQYREMFLPDPVLLRFIKEHAESWDISWDKPGGIQYVPIDRHVRWMLKEIADARGVGLEELIDQLLRGQAARLHAEIPREPAQF